MPKNLGEEEGAALALAASAQLDELVDFLSDEESGESRIYFIRPILAVARARGREIVEALRDDPVLGKEATALLSRRK